MSLTEDRNGKVECAWCAVSLKHQASSLFGPSRQSSILPSPLQEHQTCTKLQTEIKVRQVCRIGQSVLVFDDGPVEHMSPLGGFSTVSLGQAPTPRSWGNGSRPLFRHFYLPQNDCPAPETIASFFASVIRPTATKSSAARATHETYWPWFFHWFSQGHSWSISPDNIII